MENPLSVLVQASRILTADSGYIAQPYKDPTYYHTPRFTNSKFPSNHCRWRTMMRPSPICCAQVSEIPMGPCRNSNRLAVLLQSLPGMRFVPKTRSKPITCFRLRLL